MKLIDWTGIYEKYKGMWVALDIDNETVVGIGTTAEAALTQAHLKGFEDAAITYVPWEVTTFAGLELHEVSVYQAATRN